MFEERGAVRHRVYSEMLSWEELDKPRTRELLVRYGLELVLAVRPWDVPALPRVSRALRDIGVPLSVWPMLADDDGRWASVHNAPSFASFVVTMCEALAREDALPRDLLIDLEPPFADARALVRVAGSAEAPPTSRQGLLGRPSFSRVRSSVLRAGVTALAAMVTSVHAMGLTTSMAVWPLVALDAPRDLAWQALLGTPVDGLGAGHVSVMMYTSIFEGWSRGSVRRSDACALLSLATERAVRRWGARAGVSLGCVGVGAFQDEPVYRSPRELAEDVAIVRAAGCHSLSLFDLAGVLTRGPAEAWLAAFTEPSRSGDEVATLSGRVHAARVAARAATWALRFLPARA